MWFQTVARFDTGTKTSSEEAAYFDLRIFYNKVIFRNNSGDLPKLLSTNLTKPEQKMIKREVGNFQALSLVVRSLMDGEGGGGPGVLWPPFFCKPFLANNWQLVAETVEVDMLVTDHGLLLWQSVTSRLRKSWLPVLTHFFHSRNCFSRYLHTFLSWVFVLLFRVRKI